MIYTTTPFDAQQSTDDTLLIGVGTTIHTVAVVDRDRQLKFAATYTPGDIDPEIKAVLEHPFPTVKIGVLDSHYTFIPSEVYDEQHRETYLRYLPYDGVGATSVVDVPQLNLKVLHQSSRLGWEELASRFPGAVVYPNASGILHALATASEQGQGALVLIDRHESWLTIGILMDGKFVYAHDFEAHGEEDFAYHLASVLEQFELRQQRPTIQLAGEIDEHDGYYGRAVSLGGKTAIADSNMLVGVQVPEAVMPHQHRFLSLLGLYACAS